MTNLVIRSFASWFYQEAINSPAWLLEGFRGQIDVIAFGREQGSLTQIKYEKWLRNPVELSNILRNNILNSLVFRHAPCWNRTNNPVIKSHLLCQLS
jgi:hypothetical protein